MMFMFFPIGGRSSNASTGGSVANAKEAKESTAVVCNENIRYGHPTVPVLSEHIVVALPMVSHDLDHVQQFLLAKCQCQGYRQRQPFRNCYDQDRHCSDKQANMDGSIWGSKLMHQDGSVKFLPMAGSCSVISLHFSDAQKDTLNVAFGRV